MSSAFRINKFPQRHDQSVLAPLLEVETATLGHYLDSAITDPAVRLIGPKRRIAGTAVTVSIPGSDSSLLYYAMDMLQPGDVLVIDRGGDRKNACWGGFMAVAAASKRLAGVIIDGMATDPAEIIEAGVPTWSRGISATTTKLLMQGGSLNAPIVVGDIVVSPGDVILADDCGVISLPFTDMMDLGKRALADQAEERVALDKIRSGESLVSLAGLDLSAFEADYPIV